MRKIILLCAALAATTSFANVTVEQAETAMHAAEQDKSKLSNAEDVLRQAVKENPESYKANFYLSQILDETKKPDAEIYHNKAAKLYKDEVNHTMLVSLFWLFAIIAMVVGGIFGYQYYERKKSEKEEAEELDRLSSVYSRKFVDAQRELDNIVIHLEMCDVKFNNKIYNDIKEVKSAICDIVERITEGHNWTKTEAEDLLAEVTNCINYCRNNFK